MFLPYHDGRWSSKDHPPIKRATRTTKTFYEGIIGIQNHRKYLPCSNLCFIQYFVYPKGKSKRVLIVFSVMKKHWVCIMSSFLMTAVFLVRYTSEK
jgi:hypothetical protein